MAFSPIARKITYATGLYFVWFFISETLIDLALWKYDEKDTLRYKLYQSEFDLAYDFAIPFLIGSFFVFRYLRKAFAIHNLKKLFKKTVIFWIILLITSLVWYLFTGEFNFFDDLLKRTLN